MGRLETLEHQRPTFAVNKCSGVTSFAAQCNVI